MRDGRPDRCRHVLVGSSDYIQQRSKIEDWVVGKINGHACISRMVDLLQVVASGIWGSARIRVDVTGLTSDDYIYQLPYSTTKKFYHNNRIG